MHFKSCDVNFMQKYFRRALLLIFNLFSRPAAGFIYINVEFRWLKSIFSARSSFAQITE